MKHSSNQIANAITTALQLYIDGKQDFICNALEHMERNHGLSWTLSVTCIEVVRASIDDHCVFESYHDYKNQSELKVLKDVAPSIKAIGDGKGKGVLVVDDLTDTGKTARVVREMLPNAHFATVYAKPAGVPTVDTFVTEVSQDTWIYFPWDMGFTYQEPIAKGTRG